jgi:predicted secreted protein
MRFSRVSPFSLFLIYTRLKFLFNLFIREGGYMKKINVFAFIFLAVFILSCSKNSGNPKAEQNMAADSVTNPVSYERRSAKAGETVILELASNPTTGYAWHITNLDALQKVELVNNEYRAAESEEGVTGRGGVQSFVFKAKEGASGSEEVYFSYLRPWESDTAPADERILEVTITE